MPVATPRRPRWATSCARGVGEVVESDAPHLKPRMLVVDSLGWQDHATLPAADVEAMPVDGVPTAHLGVLGMTGVTAYFGMKKIGAPFPGDTVVITARQAPPGRSSARSPSRRDAG